MTVIKFADSVAYKYLTAGLDEDQIRRDVLYLWNLTNNKTYQILRQIASAELKGAPKNDKEVNAARGHAFVKNIVHIIDLLKKNLNTVDLDIIEEKLKEVVEEIELNASDGGRGTTDFADLTDYILLTGGNTTNLNKSDKRKIEGEYSKIRTIITKIHSSADSIVSAIMKSRGEDPNKDKNYRHHQRRRLVPRRAPVYEGDIVDFLRQHGTGYGLKDYDAWQIAFENDPMLKEQITTVINSLNRGMKHPTDESSVKMQVAEIMKNHEMRKANNLGALESPELPTHNFVSPQLKKERKMEQQEQDSVREEGQRRLQEMIRRRDEANKRHRLENQPSEEEMTNQYSVVNEEEQKRLQDVAKQRELAKKLNPLEEENLDSKFSSLRLKQILKRYQ